jgi:hypothetical protein
VCNFVVTDGTTVVATRMAGPGCTPASLYYASGSGWESSGAGYVMSHRERVPYAYIIASEPLTSDAKVIVLFLFFSFLLSDTVRTGW